MTDNRPGKPAAEIRPVVRHLLAACYALLLFCAHAYGAGSNAENQADRMLQRLGGREAWAALENTVNGSQQNRAGEPTVVYAVISMDFTRPRFRIDTTAPGVHVIRVIDGPDNSWRLRRSGAIDSVPPGLLAEDMAWYEAHLYRTLHRIAARDPALSLRTGDDGRLEVFAGDTRLLWFRLDAKGEPYAFGAYDDETGSLSGPWDFIRDGIHHPRWVSSADGSWRAMVKALQINVPLHNSLFARPVSPP